MLKCFAECPKTLHYTQQYCELTVIMHDVRVVNVKCYSSPIGMSLILVRPLLK